MSKVYAPHEIYFFLLLILLTTVNSVLNIHTGFHEDITKYTVRIFILIGRTWSEQFLTNYQNNLKLNV
jgi:hypothetical protein